MRSYYAHLEQAKPATQNAIASKPVYRSSAIFPVIQAEGISSRLLFMGYWILKRNIKEIACVLTLRSTEGAILFRSTLSISEPKTYRIELEEQLQLAGFSSTQDFKGSLEIEFFSSQNLFFPYPAVVVNYYGPQFSSAVHTAQRIYNDFDDLRANTQTAVPESGFNIYASENQEPFFTLINGATACENTPITMEFYNCDQEILTHTLELGSLAPYQTIFCFPARLCDLKAFLKGQVGTAKISFKVNWAFPRLVAGNWNHRFQALTTTHTYYDCEKATSKTDYWFSPKSGWHPASLMIPVCIDKVHFTNVYFYPIYSPTRFSVSIEIYDETGQLLGVKTPAKEVVSPSSKLIQICLKELCEELDIPFKENLAARLIANEIHPHPLPSRIKIGLDMGSAQKQLPCNVCVNLQPFNPAYEGKTSTFKWLPFLADQPHPTVWIMNSSPQREYQQPAKLTLTFFREQDAETLVWHLDLPANGFLTLELSKHLDLKAFFGSQIGWLTVQSTNPYTTTYYFTESLSGIVGGDHGF